MNISRAAFPVAKVRIRPLASCTARQIHALNRKSGLRHRAGYNCRFPEDRTTPVLGAADIYGIDIMIGNYGRVDESYLLLLEPEWSGLRESDEYQELIQASPLPEYWRTYGFPPRCREREDGWIECN